MDENEGTALNIFFVDENPETAAQMLCDKHVVKMVLETAQLLCSVHYFHTSSYQPVYKLTHKNHPCSIWARTSVANYVWLCQHGLALCEEYTKRYGRIHKSEEVIRNCYSHIPSIPDDQFTKPPLAMPDSYKTNDPVESYRKYYLAEKMGFATWKSEIPYWIEKVEKIA